MPISPRLRIILISGAVSAILGGATAWAIAQARQSQREQLSANSTIPANHLSFQTTPSDYVQIAVSLVVLLRQIADLFKSI